MNIRETILNLAAEKKRITTAGVVRALNGQISRQYISKILRRLVEEGVLMKAGSTRSAFYMLPEHAAEFGNRLKKRFKNKDLKEHEVFDIIERRLPALARLKQTRENVHSIFVYAFSEILNNAIEHSESEYIEIDVNIDTHELHFAINDFGIGIFLNVMQTRGLASELNAIQDILKGKTTTQPHVHSGEGIFFTSKSADVFVLESFGYRVRIDSIINDVFVEQLKPQKKGTRVQFTIARDSQRELNDVFRAYQSDESDYAFDKTDVRVKLYTFGTTYISRSQARRVLSGLEKFKTIILDFNKVPSVGQAFADEIFRVFLSRHPDITIVPVNANEAVQFMIDRVEKPHS